MVRVVAGEDVEAESLMPGGRPISDDALFGRKLGITRRTVRRLGGAEKMKSLSAEALAVLMGSQGSDRSKRNLAAHGMLPGRLKKVKRWSN